MIPSRLLSASVPILFAIVALACGATEPSAGIKALPELASASRTVVYGDDHRVDVYDHPDAQWRAWALERTVALVYASDVDDSDPNDVQLSGPTLGDYRDLCPDERFVDQITAGYCSGSLIDDDKVLTAGHCIDSQSCATMRFVFRYAMAGASTPQTITSADVFDCQAILVHANNSADDYAIVQLDRAATPRFTPAPVRTAPTAIPNGEALMVIGHPTGLPSKLDDGGWVRDNRGGTLDYFVSNLDAFGGNSGSAVYSMTGEVVGILVRGEQDYAYDDSAGCYRVNYCSDEGCRGEDSTYAFNAIDDLCQLGPAGNGLCACGDGVCEGDETSVSCWQDCDTRCGDGVCNGDESPLDCTADCGTCGNGICTDDAPGTCCTDCGCTNDDVCVANVCIPDPGEGDLCASPIGVTAESGGYTDSHDTSTAGNEYQGGCGGAGAPERVYAFTVFSETRVIAVSTGYDTVLYLRQGCEGVEVACNDDSTPPGNRGSLIDVVVAPGTYQLFVDGYADYSGPYTLEIDFYAVGGGPGTQVAFSDDFSGALADKWDVNGWVSSTLHNPTGYQGEGTPVASAVNCKRGCSLTTSQPIDLSTAATANLSFHRFVDNKFDDGDYLRVEACAGGTCDVLADWSHQRGDTNIWNGESFSLDAFAGASDVTLRFTAQSNKFDEYAQIDEVTLSYENATGCGDGTCDGGEDCTSCPSDCGNVCGGCSALAEAPGDACGTCGTVACDGTETTACDDPGLNVCGGCALLADTPGQACGACGTAACDGSEATVCNDPGVNACGGCGALVEQPGDGCGSCGSVVCDGADATVCDDPGLNACGACGQVPTEICDDGVDNDCDGDIDEDCGLGACEPSQLSLKKAEYDAAKKKVSGEVVAGVAGSEPAVMMYIDQGTTAHAMSLRKSNEWRSVVRNVSTMPTTLRFESALLGCQLQAPVTLK